MPSRGNRSVRGSLGNIQDRKQSQGSIIAEAMAASGLPPASEKPAPKKPAPKKPAGDGYVFGSMTGDPLLKGDPKKRR